MLLVLVVSVNPAVWLVHDPLIELAVRALSRPWPGMLGSSVTFRAPESVAFEFTCSVPEPNCSVREALPVRV
jgi:hypothetical protein